MDRERERLRVIDKFLIETDGIAFNFFEEEEAYGG